MTATNYTITGMTCGHCVKAVTEEVSALEGVDAVEVTFEPGAMTVTSQQPIALDKISEAVSEAGNYTVQPA